MPWESIKLNSGQCFFCGLQTGTDYGIDMSGHYIPSIAFGTWKTGNGQGPINQVKQALGNGFSHIDTAQAYKNEKETGVALEEIGLSRSDIFVTTKYSGTNGLDIPTSIRNSLNSLGVSDVDLYLVHAPRLAVPDIPTCWAQMEKVVEDGFAKSIGVSNFGVQDLETLLASAKIKPAVNQGAVVVTSSSKKERLQGYIAAGDIILSPDDIATIDAAGALGEEKPVESR
ncbi:Aldo/keto reductase [Suillus decipiens]|nr:Aldo/keto reductase [Suillus decipiens]